MNIAFPALVIILLISPGVLFSYSYRKGFFWRSPVSLGPIQDEIGSGTLWALALNGLGVGISELALRGINFEALLALLTGWPPVDASRIQSYIDAVAEHSGSIILYLLLINLAGVLLGYLLHAVVRRNHLDLRYNFLRFSNEWYYIFSGEARVFDVPEEERSVASIKEFLSTNLDFVFISAVVLQGEEPVLYWGILSDYFFNSEGKLDRIVLEQAQRRFLTADREDEKDQQTPVEDERFYEIRGDYFLVQYQNVQTLNIEYKVLSENSAV